MIFLRNLKTGEIRQVEPFSDDHAAIRFEKYTDINGKERYVWEQTSASDADPETYAHPHEIANRRAHGIEPLSFVTSDGLPTSEAAAEALAKVDPGAAAVDSPEREPEAVSDGPKPKRRAASTPAA